MSPLDELKTELDRVCPGHIRRLVLGQTGKYVCLENPNATWWMPFERLLEALRASPSGLSISKFAELIRSVGWFRHSHFANTMAVPPDFEDKPGEIVGKPEAERMPHARWARYGSTWTLEFGPVLSAYVRETTSGRYVVEWGGLLSDGHTSHLEAQLAAERLMAGKLKEVLAELEPPEETPP